MSKPAIVKRSEPSPIWKLYRTKSFKRALEWHEFMEIYDAGYAAGLRDGAKREWFVKGLDEASDPKQPALGKSRDGD